jgi:hypothetical protein
MGKGHGNSMVEYRLNIGLICNDDLNSMIIKEMLNHQGIIFREISVDLMEEQKYPCIILNGTGEATKMAYKCCLDSSAIINIEDGTLEKIFMALSGITEDFYLNDTLLNPTISEYEQKLVERIKEVLYNQNLPFVRKWFWPNFAKACYVLSHDVDQLDHRPTIKSSFLAWMAYTYWRFIKKKAYNTNIETIIREEIKRNIRSSFYFFTDYGRCQQDFIDILNLLRNNGFEIGLHGSLHSFQNPKLLRNEIQTLEKLIDGKVLGIRQHNLNFLVPHTWRYQDEVGFKYDLTFYYNDKFGFRSGICHPYHPFDALTKKKFNVLEIPTSFMDHTALSKGLSFEEMQDVFKRLVSTIERLNGCLVLNFHNRYIDNKNYPELYQIYMSILNHIDSRGEDCWIASAKECSEWWRNREEAMVDIFIENNNIYGKISTMNQIPLYFEQANKETQKQLVKGEFSLKI